jgi:hypothetical protein
MASLTGAPCFSPRLLLQWHHGPLRNYEQKFVVAIDVLSGIHGAIWWWGAPSGYGAIDREKSLTAPLAPNL